MKTPFVLMANSAMGESQRHSILSNELVRRLSTIDIEYTESEEIIRVIEEFIQEMKSSGYSRERTREVVIAGVKGWKRKIARRIKEGTDFYRTAKKTLPGRCRKKLLERENWFKEKPEDEDDNEDSNKESTMYEKGKKKDRSKPKTKSKIKAVMVVPFTKNSELAKRYRQNEYRMEDITDYRMKITERVGVKLVDMLTSSNPSKGQDCEREKCEMCNTKERTGKNKTQDCSKRNVVYETWCLDCEEKEVKKIDAMENKTEKEKVELKGKIVLFK